MSLLHRLADRVGILREYLDQTGRELRVASDETRIAILRAMGFEAATEAGARAALDHLDALERSRVAAPVRVSVRTSRRASRVELRAPGRSRREVEWAVELALENGATRRLSGRGAAGPGGRIVVELGEAPPEGYHTVRAELAADGCRHAAEQSFIVAPRACRRVRGLAGLIANLYTVRSRDDWGVGDLTVLARLLEWTAAEGGAFVGVNPLHALRNRDWDVSPYSPVSRLFRNPLYLDVTAVPGLDGCPEARRLLDSPELLHERGRLRASDRVEYERVMALKRRVLETLHAHLPRSRAYESFLRSQGEPLTRFGTFEAIGDLLGVADWRQWPGGLRDVSSAEVAAFRGEHDRLVDFHCWMQFELERQLGEAAARGRRRGLALGLYQDLAIGCAPGGADVWCDPHLFLTGASIGAPPDDYSVTGQNWGLPPPDPRVLFEDRYEFWIRLLRASLRHAGALRIDHVMGLFRQFWIPDGMSGEQGAYVRFPAADLLGILVLEATRHDAVVVGEDLGTVPPEVRPALRRRGILRSRVLYFEREGEGFRAAAAYERGALATVNTHDMAPLAGFWAGRDIELRREAGAIGSDEAAEVERKGRARARRALLERLAAEGVLPRAEEPANGAELRGAVHEFLCRTPAAMVGLSLDDLVGETEPVNLPGVPPDRFPSWTRKLATPVEALATDPGVRAALRCPGRHTGGSPASISARFGSSHGGSLSSRPSEPSGSSTVNPGDVVATSKSTPPGSRK